MAIDVDCVKVWDHVDAKFDAASFFRPAAQSIELLSARASGHAFSYGLAPQASLLGAVGRRWSKNLGVGFSMPVEPYVSHRQPCADAQVRDGRSHDRGGSFCRVCGEGQKGFVVRSSSEVGVVFCRTS